MASGITREMSAPMTIRLFTARGLRFDVTIVEAWNQAYIMSGANPVTWGSLTMHVEITPIQNAKCVIFYPVF